MSRLDSLRFLLKRHLRLFEIPDFSMSGKELSKELSRLVSGTDVLEFGSGGSTLLLGKFANSVISVESDKHFVKFMKKKLKQLLLRNVEVVYANIGPTVRYGYPDPKKIDKHKNKYSRYTEAGFEVIDCLGLKPKVIFIDGRFRVWCAIQAVTKLSGDFKIVFDDFYDRQQYSAIQEILGGPYKKIGNTAFFQVDSFTRTNLDKLKNSQIFQSDPE